MFFFSCSTVDLKNSYPNDVFLNDDLSYRAEEVIKVAFEKNRKSNSVTAIELSGVDFWKSRFVWLFTPCTETLQEFQAILHSETEDIHYVFKNGRKKGLAIGIKDKKEYDVEDKELEYSSSYRTLSYLRPMFNYMYWSFRITNQKYKSYLGEELVDTDVYHKVYLSNSKETSEVENQYIVYIHKEKGTIDYIQFTLRELFTSYQGVIRYKSYREVNGVWLPFEIEVGDSLASKKYIHKLVFSNVTIR
jgi:hypothetical protein